MRWVEVVGSFYYFRNENSLSLNNTEALWSYEIQNDLKRSAFHSNDENFSLICELLIYSTGNLCVPYCGFCSFKTVNLDFAKLYNFHFNCFSTSRRFWKFLRFNNLTFLNDLRNSHTESLQLLLVQKTLL